MGRSRTQRELIEFRPSYTGAVVKACEELTAARAGWMNIEPYVDEDDLPPRSAPSVFGLFSSKGPLVPVATFVAGDASTRIPASLGIQHGAGVRAVHALADAGLTAPAEWQLRQDHPRRGLVWEMHPDRIDGDAVVAFVVTAIELLGGMAFTDRWYAVVFRP